MTTYTVARDMVIGPDSQLKSICYGALLKLANDILNESPSTAGYIVRRKWAERVRRDPSFVMQPALVACAFNAGIRTKMTTDPTGASVTDAEVEAVLTGALWPLIAESL